MVARLLIANRGEIACRIMRTARAMGISPVAVYSEADRNAAHVALADDALLIGPAPAAESYLRGEVILEAAKRLGADAIHPGYGFLSENAGFAEAVANAGLIWVGPPPSAIRAMGLKDGAKRLMEEAGVPVVPGYHGDRQDTEFLKAEAARIGYPVLIKAVAGGGGKGMRKVEAADDFDPALSGAQREAQNAFGDPRVLIEKYVTQPRHVEIQVFADGHGHAVHLFERDCSLQRRHQKVIEEAPAPGMPEEVRAAMGKAAVDAAKAIGYQGAGTVEFIADGSQGLRADGFYFMEMNTRLQVEHPVTEFVTGLDLVEWQLRVARGEKLPLAQSDIALNGHAFEARLYAENPATGFLPSTGTLHRLRLPDEGGPIRVDTGVREGDEVSIHYDPMIAKIITWGETRESALRRLHGALGQVEVAGLTANAGFLREIAGHAEFQAGRVDTGFIERHLGDLVHSTEAPSAEIKLLAGLFVAAERRARASQASPWDAQDGFRIGAWAEEVIRFAAPEEFELRFVYTPDGLEVMAGGRMVPVSADLGYAGHLRASLDGVRLEAGAMGLGSDIVIFKNGYAFTLSLHDPMAAGLAESGGEAQITAPMPGKIIAVHVQPGDAVKKGQALIVLEAMKMEHTLSAGRDGVVESVSAKTGDQVPEGAVIVALSPEEG